MSSLDVNKNEYSEDRNSMASRCSDITDSSHTPYLLDEEKGINKRNFQRLMSFLGSADKELNRLKKRVKVIF